jgi:hypothetical protein
VIVRFEACDGVTPSMLLQDGADKRRIAASMGSGSGDSAYIHFWLAA